MSNTACDREIILQDTEKPLIKINVAKIGVHGFYIQLAVFVTPLEEKSKNQW